LEVEFITLRIDLRVVKKDKGRSTYKR